jgi:carbonic anhydrase
VLEVQTITVCGHSGCGAMAALLGKTPDLPGLRGWLRHGTLSLDRFRSFEESEAAEEPAGPDGASGGSRLDKLCRINVIQQLDNLRTHPLVDDLVRSGRLELTGLYFDIGTARVHVLDDDGFTPVPERSVTE